jgi:hypothetical protein
VTIDELVQLGEAPIMTRGMRTGLVIRWNISEKEIGISLPGEDTLLWVKASDVVDLSADKNGALATIDALCD